MRVKTIALILLVFGLLFISLAISSTTAYATLADSNTTTSTVYNSRYGRNVTSVTLGGITFQETFVLDTNLNHNYVYSADNYIYLDEDLSFSRSLVGSQFIFNFYNSGLGLYQTERYSYFEYTTYAVQDRSQTESRFTKGDYLEYGNQYSGTPAFDVTIKNGGYTSTGRYVNIVITYQYIYIERFRDTLLEAYDPYPDVLHFYEGASIYELMTIESMQDSSAYEIEIAFYYTDTGELVDDATFVWAVEDLDVVVDGTNRGNQFDESVWFIDGVDYVEMTRSPSSGLNLTRMSFTSSSGTTYSNLVRLYPEHTLSSEWNESLASGFITEVDGGSVSFLWTGRACGTNLALLAGGWAPQ